MQVNTTLGVMRLNLDFDRQTPGRCLETVRNCENDLRQ